MGGRRLGAQDGVALFAGLSGLPCLSSCAAHYVLFAAFFVHRPLGAAVWEDTPFSLFFVFLLQYSTTRGIMSAAAELGGKL